MLKVKNLTHLTPKKLKKGGNFDHGCKKNRALLDFFCNLVSRFGLILTKILFSIEWTYFQGASFIINWVMVIFSPQPLKKWIFLDFFVKVTPPGTVKMQKCAIFAMDSIRWWCLLSKNHRISNLRELFHNEKYRAFTQHAAIAVMRHSATMG